MNTKNITLCFFCLISLMGFADNPIIQTCYTADPAPLVYKDTLFLYTGHDEDKSTWFVMNNWRCFSTTDMVNWTDRGTPLSYKTFSWASGDAWAGQCIQRNGKFYWYVPVKDKIKKDYAIGVAVSDKPTGPFVDAIGKPLVEAVYGYIDPTVFIDTDGQAYLYFGNPGLHYVKLNENMVSYAGEVVHVELTEQGFGKRYNNKDRATQYEEAPWLYKRKGLYYLLYAGGGVPENISYSTSKSPTGPWVFQDTIMPVQGGSFTNHEGIIDYKGHSYFFYHNGALPGGGGFTRSACVEEFKYNADGTIPTFNMTKEGPKAVGNLNPYKKVEAETMAWGEGVETEVSSEGGINITDIQNGDYIKLKDVKFNHKKANFEVRVASANANGIIEIRLDSLSGALLGTCHVSSTGSWQKWETQSTKLTAAKGVHDAYLVFKGNAGDLFKLNWYNLKK